MNSERDQIVTSNFGVQMRTRVRPEWIEHNLRFDDLSRRLVSVKQEFRLRKAVSSRSLTGETRTFAEILDQEVEKIVLFYLQQQGELAKRLSFMREKQVSNLQGSPVTLDELDSYLKNFRTLSQEVLDLLEYLDLNVIGLRRILKKHDKQFDSKMSNMYFDSRLGNAQQHSQLVQLYHQEGLRAIIGTIRRGFEDIYEAKDALVVTLASPSAAHLTSGLTLFRGPSSGCGDRVSSSPMIAPLPRVPYTSRVASFSAMHLPSLVDGPTSDGAERGVNNSWLRSMSSQTRDSKPSNRSSAIAPEPLSSSIPSSFKRSLSVPLFSTLLAAEPKPIERSISDLEPVLKRISETADRVMRSQKQTTADYIASHSSMAVEMRVRDMERESDELDEEYQPGGPKAEAEQRTSSTGLYLNLFITFLYQANQYVVAPTSGKYADMLGMSASMSGAIIGMSPFAAIISALVFSAWTNSSFKQPLLVSLSFLVVGNLLVGLALQCGSPMMVFLGRLLTGLGGPRGISRRYIADHVSYEDRTMASSHFVTAGALGLAFGPLVSSLVSSTHQEFVLGLGPVVLVRYEEVTAPGWIMTVAFLGCLVAFYFFFEEPVLRKHKSANGSVTNSWLSWCCCWCWRGDESGMGSQGRSSGMRKSSDNLGAGRGYNGEYDVLIGVETLDLMAENDDGAGVGPGSGVQMQTGSSYYQHQSASAGSGGGGGGGGGGGAPSTNYSGFVNDDRRLGDVGDSGSTGLGMFGRIGSGMGMSSRGGSGSLVGGLKESDYASIEAERAGAGTAGCQDFLSVEVAIILFIYFVNKVGQEMVVSAVPTLCFEMFGWTSQADGLFMAAMGAMVLPGSVLVSQLAKDAEDRLMMMHLSILCLASILLLLNTFMLSYSLVQYLLGSVLLFAFLNALEGVIMSLLSKLVSPELAKGTFNSGLLSTEAGNVGRVVGDVAITVLGVMTTDPTLLVNYLFLPLAAGIVMCMVITFIYFDKFAV